MKLSIVTINYNNCDGLKQTMESVFAQTCKDFEYVVVDGASTDGSVDVIREYDSLNAKGSTLNAFIWVSEKDSGIYNAMNKGIRMAKGEYVLMLNSGDYFVNEHVVERILPVLDGTDIVQGNTIEGGKKNCGYGCSEISFVDVYCGRFLHQASFVRNELFHKYGFFDETYRINGDTVFYAKCLGFGNASFKYVDIDVANFDQFGISSDPEKRLTKLRAEEDLRYYNLFSDRLTDLIKDYQRKAPIYDSLHRYKMLWYIAMALVRLSNLLSRK